jgi:hypothetical protein
MTTKPVPGLTFLRADGSRGSTRDYLGNYLVLVIISLDCTLCVRTQMALKQVLLRAAVPHLALCERLIEDHETATQTDFPKAFAPLPEVYLGLGIPRGTWIKYPTLIVLDEEARVVDFCSDPQKVLEASYLDSVLVTAQIRNESK